MNTRSEAFEASALTDTGLVRSQNEDAPLSRPDLGVFLVADGMGGHAAGDFASAAIVGQVASVGLASSLDDLEARFMERLARAHVDVVARGEALGTTVGATVVALIFSGAEWACIWAGDSRAYRLRDGRLRQLSSDHTEVAELVARGAITAAEAVTWPRRNVITRAIGVGEQADCDSLRGEAAAGDVFLLCSDGLTEHLDDARIADHLARPGATDGICRALIDETLAKGATDNVTCVVVRVLAVPVGE